MRPNSFSERLALTGLFASGAIMLSLVESMFPAIALPGAKLGLANVSVTAAMWMLGIASGVAAALIKVLFCFITRGITAALMSALGTLFAVIVTAALLPLYKKHKLTFVGVSIASAAAHTIGQLCCAFVLMGQAVWGHAPLMLLLSIPAGTLTGLVLNVVIPRLPPQLLRQTKRKKG